jgi:outer membrane protein insertion porin family
MRRLIPLKFGFLKKIIQILCCAVVLTLSITSQANDQIKPFVVKAIEIQGLHSILHETALSYLPIQVGQTFDINSAPTLIEQLYDTGFFEDIRLNIDTENVLKIVVTERPIISDFHITGNQSFPKKELDGLLQSACLSIGEYFDSAALDNVKKQLITYYRSRGHYLATIKTTLQAEAPYQVRLAVRINEGPIVRIAGIRILGNKAFTESQLLAHLPLAPHRFLGFLTQSNQYTQEKRVAALEILRNFYLDRGYFNIQINSDHITLTPDRRAVYWSIQLTEGPRYTLKSHQIAGYTEGLDTPPASLIKTKCEHPFNQQAVQTTEQAVKESLGSQGYLSPVHTVSTVDEKNKVVDLLTYIEPTKRVYVRHILITGNIRTQDEAIRRLLLQQEASLFSLKDLRESIRRLDASGLTDGKTEVQIVPVPNGPDDQVDIHIKVKEGNYLQLGLNGGMGGFLENFMFDSAINAPNILGTGSHLAVSADINQFIRSLTLNYHNPFYTLTGIQRSIALYGIHYDNTKREELTQYLTSTVGGKLHFNFPVGAHGDGLQIGFGGHWKRLHLPKPPNLSDEIAAFKNRYGTIDQDNIDFNQALLELGWERNTCNKFLFPTQGIRQNISAKLRLAIDGKDLFYYKSHYIGAGYIPLARTASEFPFVFTYQWHLGYGTNFKPDQSIPFFENYRAGGIDSDGIVRGYKNNSLGPKDSLGKVLGGNLLTAGTVAIILPEPFSQERFRVSLFFDVGNVYAASELFSSEVFRKDPLRISCGVAVQCIIPVVNAQLQISAGMPLNARDRDTVQLFQLRLGMGF